ncbi:DNA primase [Burkholderia cepacia]|uniref:DNA primase n=1 Tax=Burkholderia cepacia TaxID=292 RepID=UPI000A3E6EC8|nr:DNA primase [Burkholderia cepacia]
MEHLPQTKTAMSAADGVAVLDAAATFYRAQLRACGRAVAYLKGRGIRGETAARFGVGYAPPEFQALAEAFPDYADQVLSDYGLVAVSDNGRRYDRFRDRVMFPIRDASGRVVGFGGRLLGGDGPKYLNSPETRLFQKGRLLFGLHQAADAIAATSTVYVVEGYMDVISLAQSGIENAVAALGTATTRHHVEQLLARASRVVFCFDGDEAGRRAAARALDVCVPCIRDEHNVSFLFLPAEHDPDSFVQAHGGEAFAELAREAVPLERYMLMAATQGQSLEYAEGRARLVSTIAPRLQMLRAPALLRRVLLDVSTYARIAVSDLIASCGLDKKSVKTIDGQ